MADESERRGPSSLLESVFAVHHATWELVRHTDSRDPKVRRIRDELAEFGAQVSELLLEADETKLDSALDVVDAAQQLESVVAALPAPSLALVDHWRETVSRLAKICSTPP